jgi:hypothetical protein
MKVSATAAKETTTGAVVVVGTVVEVVVVLVVVGTVEEVVDVVVLVVVDVVVLVVVDVVVLVVDEVVLVVVLVVVDEVVLVVVDVVVLVVVDEVVLVVVLAAVSMDSTGRRAAVAFEREAYVAPLVLSFAMASVWSWAPPWMAAVTSTVYESPLSISPRVAIGRVKSGTNGEVSRSSTVPSPLLSTSVHTRPAPSAVPLPPPSSQPESETGYIVPPSGVPLIA